MKKATLNYWVDMGIGISFVLSALSGLVFLLPVGADAGPGSSVLGVSYPIWSQLHTWSSLGLMAGVLAHLVLHWKWIIGMTRKMLLPAREPRKEVPSAPGTDRCILTRRQFLSLGLTTILSCATAISWSTLTKNQSMDVEQGDPAPDSDHVATADEPEESVDSVLDPNSGAPTNSPESPANEPEQPAQQLKGVACPRGMVNDPYPGRCRFYTDRNDDGICDYSVPGSGNN